VPVSAIGGRSAKRRTLAAVLRATLGQDRHARLRRRSRFLKEAAVARFEQIEASPEPAQPDEGSLEPVTTTSIRAGVRSLRDS